MYMYVLYIYGVYIKLIEQREKAFGLGGNKGHPLCHKASIDLCWELLKGVAVP